MVFLCTVCDQEIETISGLCTHLRIVHPLSILNSLKCCVCGRTYTTLQYLREHLTKKHPEGIMDAPNQNAGNDEEDFNNVEMDDEQVDNPAVQVNEEVENYDVTLLEFKTSIYKSSLGLAAKLYADNTLNRTQIQNIIKIVSDFTGCGFLDVLKQKTLSILRFNNIEQGVDFQELNEMFDSLGDVFSGLSTDRQRVNAFEESDCFVAPDFYEIGVGQQIKTINGNPVPVPVMLCGQHISMKSLLKKFLQLPGVLREVMRNVEHLKNSRHFTNIIQSPLWKNIERTHFMNRTVFPLTVYFDDAEPDNNTGAHAGSHKLGMVYYQIACIPQHLLSSLENIFVASVFLSDNKREHIERTFKPVLSDLKDLETNGILVETEHGDFQIYFALTCLLGDNLGVHTLNGYTESFSANFYCRVCRVHKRELRLQLREDLHRLRTVRNYLEDVLLNDVSQTGIKFECFWNELLSYHVVLNVAFDLMHDLFEGVCHYDLCALLMALISMNFFSLETLNERIQCFNYGFDSANKPSIITMENIRNERLRMTASEMFFFVRHLGLFIGDLVPEGNEEWQLYVFLAEIISIVCAPFVREGSSAYLATLVSEHHEIYINVFNKTLKPKHHFMVHYARVRDVIGPFINLWCMRFEGKHRPVVKQSARSHTCRKNLPLTTAMRYSLGLCARFLAKKGFPDDVLFSHKEQNLRDYQNFENFENVLPPGYENGIVVKEVTICGTTYQPKMVLAVGNVDDLPLFASIQGIVKPVGNNCKACFLLLCFHTVGFNSHLNCYEVRSTQEWFFESYENLVSYCTTQCRTGANGRRYVTFKHEL